GPFVSPSGSRQVFNQTDLDARRDTSYLRGTQLAEDGESDGDACREHLRASKHDAETVRRVRRRRQREVLKQSLGGVNRQRIPWKQLFDKCLQEDAVSTREQDGLYRDRNI